MSVIKTIKMSVKDWSAVEDNPIQRDTERHAAKAKHLLTPLPTHLVVHAGQLPSGKLIKLDGHTRALMWTRGDIPMPGLLEVVTYPIKDRAEAETLYKAFDSTFALETMRDKVSGAFNKYNFEPKSGLLKGGSITNSLRISYAVLRGAAAIAGQNAGVMQQRDETSGRKAVVADPYTMIAEFSPELIILDSYNLTPSKASAGVVAGFIITTRRYGAAVTEFWTDYFGDNGVKTPSGLKDGVQLLHEYIIARKGNYGGSANAELCARVVGAVEMWMNDHKKKGTKPPEQDLIGYLVGHEKPNIRLLKKADIRVNI